MADNQHGGEGEEVGWRSEGLRCEGREGHAVDDCGEEDGEGCEGDVDAEEHEGLEVGFGVEES